jgi:tellurite resistance protein TerC
MAAGSEMISGSPMMWGLFTLFVVGALAIDLGVLNRKAHTPTFREAALWCLVWFILAMAFCAGLYDRIGHETAASFLAGYLVELSLSVDNLFVFIMVFEFFRVEQKHQHRVLFWGIIGAVILRAIFIFAGLEMIERFHWLLYVMGAFLIFIGIKMMVKGGDSDEDFGESTVVKVLKKIIPLSKNQPGAAFFVKEKGRWLGTPLFLVLVAVDVVDVIFAVDSIPAVIAITRDPFIVFTSNIFAILGLRSMFFLISGVMNLFRFLAHGVSVILIFIGVKMLTADYYHIPVTMTLSFMILVLFVSIFLSVMFKEKKKK